MNDKNHLYGPHDAARDRKDVEKRRDWNQYSQFSAAIPANLLAVANAPGLGSVQIDSHPLIGHPYDDSKGEVGLSNQVVSLGGIGSGYTFYTVTGDVAFRFADLPAGRFIEFTLDILVDNEDGVAITFPQCRNPPVLPGNDGDRYVLTFVGVVRASGDGSADPVSTYSFVSGAIGGGGGGNVPAPTAQYQHLESTDANTWQVSNDLALNNSRSLTWRAAAADVGTVGLRVNSANRLVMTNDVGAAAVMELSAPLTDSPTSTLLISQSPGAVLNEEFSAGATLLGVPRTLSVLVDGGPIASFLADQVNIFQELDMNDQSISNMHVLTGTDNQTITSSQGWIYTVLTGGHQFNVGAANILTLDTAATIRAAAVTGAVVPTLNFERVAATANGDVTGNMVFKGKDSDGVLTEAATIYASILRNPAAIYEAALNFVVTRLGRAGAGQLRLTGTSLTMAAVTDAAAVNADIGIYKNYTPPTAVTDFNVGNLVWFAKNADGVSLNVTHLLCRITDKAADTFSSQLSIYNRRNNSVSEAMRFDGTVKIYDEVFMGGNNVLGVGDLGLNSRTVSSAPSGNVILAAKDSDDNALGLRYYAPAGDHRFHVGGTNVATIGTGRLTIRDDGLLGLQMYRYTNPAIVGDIGGLQMRARNSEAEIVTYADIIAKTVTLLDGSEGGSLELGVAYSGSTDGMTFQMLPRSFNFELRDPTALGLFFDLYANSSSPANNDDIGILRFEGNDDEGNKRTYGGVWCEILDVDADDPDGELDIGVLDDGTLRSYIFLQGSHGVTVSKELSMNSNKITSLATPTAATDAATKAYVDASGGGLPALASGNMWIGNSSGVAVPADFGGVFTITNLGFATLLNSSVRNEKLAPAAVTNAKVASGTFSNIRGLGAQSQDLDMSNNDVDNVNIVNFNRINTVGSSGTNWISASTGGMHYNTLSGDLHEFTAQGQQILVLSRPVASFTNSANHFLQFSRTGTVANNSEISRLEWLHGAVTYAKINVLTHVVASATRAGYMAFGVAKNGGNPTDDVILRGFSGGTHFNVQTNAINLGLGTSAIGFYGVTPVGRPTVGGGSTDSRLASLIFALENLGLIET